MQRNLLPLFAGGALTLTILFAGCRSQSPFTDHSANADHPRSADALRENNNASRSLQDPSETSTDDLPILGDQAQLADYQRYAALTNPGLEARFHEWKAALERVPQVRTLPDPRLTLGSYLAEVETRVGAMQHSVSLSQTLPWFGKLDDQEDAAARAANAAYERFKSARLALSFEVEAAYNELFYLKRAIDIASENIEILQQFERVAQTRYRVAATGHPDIIRIQVELGKLEDRLQHLHDLRKPYTARLNAVLNRAPSTDVPWPHSIADRHVTISDEALVAALERKNPELLALQEEIERRRIESERADKDRYPDLTVGLAYTAINDRRDVVVTGNGDDAVLATISINIPVWKEKYDAGVREAVAHRLATAARHQDTANRLASRMQQAIFEHKDAERRVALYRDALIPKASESLQASLGAFEQGESDFLDLVEAQQTLLEFQLLLERARVDRATSYAQIEKLIGVPVAELNQTSNTEGEPS